MLKVRELVRSMEAEERAFIQTFHRLPTAEDPTFFQPDTDTPVPMEPAILCSYLSELANRTGATAAEVYAYHKMDRQPNAEQTVRNFEAAVHEAYRIMLSARNQPSKKGLCRGGAKRGLKLLKSSLRKV